MGKRIDESTADDSHNLVFAEVCLQLVTSQNTALCRYDAIFETVYYRRAFPDTAPP